eukprot:TRINITY_DN2528_c0_g2_i5.p1 TRINITY_DN2528_c0_g2~~TRINITY_DN2528_c0_g2_i5.p1  ORF type:complete len:765 (+),score=168.01 TRINITY_DN2528_c0_g2_i5:217-2295(+)
MSCIELMDRKTDSGSMMDNIYTLPELLQGNLIPFAADLSADQIIGIMDKVFSLEFMWYDGTSLAQSLWTCLYFHNPETMLNDHILRAYLFLTLKKALLIKKFIDEAAAFDDEDFLPKTFGFKLDYDIDIDELYDNAIDLLNKMEQKCAGNEEFNDIPSLQEDPDLELSYIRAIESRLTLSKEILNILTIFQNERNSGLNSVKHDLPKFEDIIEQLKSPIQSSVPEYIFQDDIFRRLFPDVNTTKECISFEDSIARQEKLVEGWEMLTSVYKLKSINQIECFVYSMERKNCDTLTKAIFVNLFNSDNSNVIFENIPISEIVTKDGANTYGLPKKHMLLSVNTPLNEEVCDIVEKIGKCMIDYIKILCSNPSRRRMKLTDCLIEWKYLLIIGDLYDIEISKLANITVDDKKPHRFYMWMADWIVKISVYVLRLGFDLELYDDHEYIIVYWYIYSLLNQIRSHHNFMMEYNKKYPNEIILPIQNNVQNNTNTSNRKRGGRRNRGKRGRKKGNTQTRNVNQRPGKKRKPKKIKITESFLNKNLAINTEARYYNGVLNLLIALKIIGKLPEAPDFTFGSPQTRFEARFEIIDEKLANILPRLTYDKFSELIEVSKASIADLVESSMKFFNQVKIDTKKLMQKRDVITVQVEELKQLMMASLNNYMQLQLNSTKLNTPGVEPIFLFSNNFLHIKFENQ